MADDEQLETLRDQRIRLYRAAQQCGVVWHRRHKDARRATLTACASGTPVNEVFRWIAYESVERAAATLYHITLANNIARHATAAERAAFIAGAYWEIICDT